MVNILRKQFIDSDFDPEKRKHKTIVLPLFGDNVMHAYMVNLNLNVVYFTLTDIRSILVVMIIFLKK